MADENAAKTLRETQPLLEKNIRTLGTSTLRVTEEGLEDYLSDNPEMFPEGPDTYEPAPTSGDHGTHDDHEDQPGIPFPLFPLFPVRKDYIGVNLDGKHPPTRPLDVKGPDPKSRRHFVGDEFQGMLTFDGNGTPAFHSRFPEAANVQDIKEINLSIATKLPDFMQPGSPTRENVDALADRAFFGRPLEDAFAKANPKMLEQVKRYAKEFTRTYGIKMNVSVDHPNPHVSLMGYGGGDPDLLGFAAFPPGINDWPHLDGLGHHPAFLMLNNDFSAHASQSEIYNLFVHEFGHTMGFAHPHDLGQLKMGKVEALSATKMAYTDLQLQAFRHVVTDADGKPVTHADGSTKYYADGPDEGALDYSFRKWVGDAPAVNRIHRPNPQDPQNDLYKGVYDLAAHQAQALEINAESIVLERLKMLPMVPMINAGKHTVMKGTAGNDILDCNEGYASIVTDPASGARQKFILVEGHMERVMGITGDNTIIPCKDKNQVIEPGDGKNSIEFLYPETSGHKTIVSTGHDTLVLSRELLESRQFTATKTGDAIQLSDGNATIELGGRGVNHIQVIGQRGEELFTLSGLSGHTLSARRIQKALLDAEPWKEAEKEKETEKAPVKKKSRAAKGDDASPDKPQKPAASSWAERIAAEKETIRETGTERG